MRILFPIVLTGGLCFAGYHYLEQKAAGPPIPEVRTAVPAASGASLQNFDVRQAVSLIAKLLPGNNSQSFAGQSPLAARTAAPANYRGAVYYGPGRNLEVVDGSAIFNSRCNHLDVAMYAFTDYALAQVIVRFASSGRPVRIYRDRAQYEQENQRNSYIPNLFRGSRNISVRVKGSRTLMHEKTWTDGCTLREGSANWSPGGEKQQDNTLTLSADPGAIRDFEANFKAMWDRPDNLTIQ